ncbi:hypothetical protein [Nocardia crassostreae]|uniref:hypothetical protein n=1 Tax=Nocardia crassostreae TaxID=53428 RepID=UPI00082CE575|nr:hypothetical protein [Nocardia crassostreae]
MRAEIASELQRLQDERRTGVLRAGDGAFHLAHGAIAAAECRRTTGLDRLVVEAGVATPVDWQRAEAGEPDRVLARPRLETFALLAVFDAAYFLLGAPAAAAAGPEFEPAPAHWLAPACQVTPRALVHECARRGDPATGPWPAELADRAPVVPVRRARRRRVLLAGGQAEVLTAADARRSVAAIAHDLGRTTYGCLVAVRDLTAAGLIEPPGAVRIPVVMAESMVTEPVSADTAVTGPRPLARRRVRQTVQQPAPEQWEPADRDVLIRLRAALEQLA